MTLVIAVAPPRADVGGDRGDHAVVGAAALLQPQPALARGDLEVPAHRLGRASRWRSSARSSSPTRRSRRDWSRRCCSTTWCATPRASRSPWLHAAFVLLFVGYGTKMGLAPMHTWKPDAYGEAPGVVGALLAGGVTSCAFLAILRVLPDLQRRGRGRVRPRAADRHGPALDGGRRRVHGRPARLQAHARLLQRRAHGHPGPRASASAGCATFGALLHLLNNGLTKGVLFLSAGNIHRAYGSKLTDDVRGRHPARAGSRARCSWRVLRHHRLAPVRARSSASSRSSTPPSRAGSFVAGGAVPAAARDRVHRHGRHRACGGAGRAAARRPAARGYQRAAAHRRPADRLFSALVLLLGVYIPPPLERAAARGRRLPGGQAMNDQHSVLTLANGAAVAARDRSRVCRSTRFRSLVDRRARARRAASPRSSGTTIADDRAGARTPSSPTTRTALCRSAGDGSTSDDVSLADAATARRSTSSSGRSPSSAGSCPTAIPGSSRSASTARIAPATTRGASTTGETGHRRHRLLPGRGRGGPRGRGRPGPRRRHRAGALPLPVPRRAGVPPRDLARLPAPRRRARARRRPGQADASTTSETLAGDTTVGHATAYCQAVEALAGTRVPRRGAGAPRRSRLELERLANHTGDLGALAGDVGFLPTASYCGRLRGDFLNLTRRSVRQPLRPRAGPPGRRRLRRRTPRACKTCRRSWTARTATSSSAVKLLWDTPSVHGAVRGHRARRPTASPRQLGLVGLGGARLRPRARRAQDSSRGLSTASPTSRSPPGRSGDVFARAYVRWLEIQRSVEFLARAARPASGRAGARPTPGRSRPDHLAVSLVEGWRGEICHVALTDAAGASPRTRSSIRRSTTGPAWRWRCATSRSRTSRSATRASTSRTADTTCEDRDDASQSSRACSRATARAASRRGAEPRRIASAACRSSTTRVARTAAAPAPRPARRTPWSPPTASWRSTWAAACSARDCTQACPEGAIAFTRDYRLAGAKRADLVVSSPAPEPRPDRVLALDKEIRRLLRPLAQAPRR